MNRIWSLTIASTALLFSMQGFSANTASPEPACNTYAADYTKNAETYFYLDTGSALNGQPADKVAELGTLLDGKWRGHSSALNCIHHYTDSVSETEHYSVEAEIVQKFNGALRIEAEKSNKRSVKLTSLYLAPELKRLNAPDWRNYSIEFLSPTRIRFDHKYRVRNGNSNDPFFDTTPRFPGRAICQDALYQPTDLLMETLCEGTVNSSRLIHEIKEINLQNNQLTVDHQLFLNGLFVSQERWMLHRG